MSKNAKTNSIKNELTLFSILGRIYDEDFISLTIAYLLEKDIELVKKIIGFYKDKKCNNELCGIENIAEIEVKCKRITDYGKLNIFLVAKGASKDIAIMIENRIQKRERITKSEEVQIDGCQRLVSKEYPNCYNIFCYLRPNWNKSDRGNKNFITIYYSELLDMISKTDDVIIKNLQNHIKYYLVKEKIQVSENHALLIEPDMKITDLFAKYK